MSLPTDGNGSIGEDVPGSQEPPGGSFLETTSPTSFPNEEVPELAERLPTDQEDLATEGRKDAGQGDLATEWEMDLEANCFDLLQLPIPADLPSPLEIMKGLLRDVCTLIKKQQRYDAALIRGEVDVEQTHAEHLGVLKKACSLLEELQGVLHRNPDVLEELSFTPVENASLLAMSAAGLDFATRGKVYQPVIYQALVLMLDYGFEAHRGEGRSFSFSKGMMVHHVLLQHRRRPGHTPHHLLLGQLVAHQERAPQVILQQLQGRTPPQQTLPLLQQQLLLLIHACGCLGEVTPFIVLGSWEARGLVRSLLRLLLPEDLHLIQHKHEYLMQQLDNDRETQQEQQLQLQEKMLWLQTAAGKALGNIADTWPAACKGFYEISQPVRAAQSLLEVASRQLVLLFAFEEEQQEGSELHVPEETISAIRRVAIAIRLRRQLHCYFPHSCQCEIPKDRASEAVDNLADRVTSNVAILQVEVYQQQALLSSSCTEERRKCIVQVLWCLATDMATLRHSGVLKPEAALPFVPPPSIVAANCPELATTLLQIIDLALRGAARAKQMQHHELLQRKLLQMDQLHSKEQLGPQRQLRSQQRRQPQPQLRPQHQDHDDTVVRRMDSTGVDAIAPALQILSKHLRLLFMPPYLVSRSNSKASILCWLCVLSSETMVMRTYVGDMWLWELTQSLQEVLIDVLQQILRAEHYRETSVIRSRGFLEHSPLYMQRSPMIH